MDKELIEKDREYSKRYEALSISKYDIMYFLENDDNLEKIKQEVDDMSDKDMKHLAALIGGYCDDLTEFLTDHFILKRKINNG